MQTPIEIGRAILAAQTFSQLLGTRMNAYGDAGVELELPITDQLKQQNGFVHGGVMAYLADNAISFAGGFAMGGGVLTAEIMLNYLRPGTGEALIARASVVSAGRTQAVSRCEIFAVSEGQEKLCAVSQGMVLRAAGVPRAQVDTLTHVLQAVGEEL